MMLTAALVVAVLAVAAALVLWHRMNQHRTNAAHVSAVLDALPVATLVHDARGELVVANRAARELFFLGRDVVGGDFVRMLADAAPALRESVTSPTDGIKRLAAEDGGESLLLWRRSLPGDRPLEMIVTVPLGDDVARVESDAWRRVLRMVAHEINNTLTPITTLLSTGRKLQPRTGGDDRLHTIFETIEERTRHLARFIDQYARVARLPHPTPALCALPAVLERVTHLFGGITPRLSTLTAYADPAQLEQVLINLVKNAREAAGPSGTVEVFAAEVEGGTLIKVLDDGPGLAPSTLSEVSVPFFTTKPTGTGLGLTLCREVVEAHGGRFAIGNRDVGGAVATVWLPGPGGGTLTRRLTLSRS